MTVLRYCLPLVLLALGLSACKKEEPDMCKNFPLLFDESDKIKGVSFDASIFNTTDTIFNSVVEVNAQWVTLLPFGYINPEPYDFFWNTGGWWGFSNAGIEALAQYAHDRKLKVMIKPQISIAAGTVFTGNYTLPTEEEWLTFQNEYRTFILEYADLASAVNAEVFCIGNEWRAFVLQRPTFWKNLIVDVRTKFNGLLTYAANWDEYEAVPFWSDLDFIGINGYFPLSDQQTPQVQELVDHWQTHIEALDAFCSLQQKQVVFTEYGYRSVDYATKEPWSTEEFFGNEHLNLTAQQNAYEGFYQALWEKRWFGGGFLWKWFGYHAQAGGEQDNRFTPQNKPAETTIQLWYGKP